MAERFWLAFLLLFVAFDAVGVVPIYWTLSQGVPAAQRRQAVRRAVCAAFVVALAFLWLSEQVFHVMGIEMPDVMIAGGVILFVLALRNLLGPEKMVAASVEAIGVVPLGVPLLVGPAVLTTALLARQRYGLWPTVGSIGLNVLLSWALLLIADQLMERVGRDGAQVVSKVFSLVLAAFAVMLVRQGITALLP